jgi:hypothetical protein
VGFNTYIHGNVMMNLIQTKSLFLKSEDQEGKTCLVWGWVPVERGVGNIRKG